MKRQHLSKLAAAGVRPLAQLLAQIALALPTALLAASDSGSNCALMSPPNNAGYTALLGVPVRVYPSHEAVTEAYSGCQVLWVVDGASESLELRIRYERGRPVFISTATADMEEIECSELPPRPGKTEFSCEFALPLPVRSYPRECLKSRTSPADSVGIYVDPKCQ